MFSLPKLDRYLGHTAFHTEEAVREDLERCDEVNMANKTDDMKKRTRKKAMVLLLLEDCLVLAVFCIQSKI